MWAAKSPTAPCARAAPLAAPSRLADPAADWLTTVVALEADIALVGPNGRRTMPATDFVIGSYMTALDHAELLEAVVVPRRPKGERWGHYKATRKVGEYGELIAIALHDKDSGKTRLVLGAADGAPIVLEKTAAALSQKATAERLSQIIRDELVASERGFSPSKLHLHSTVALRAIQNAGLL